MDYLRSEGTMIYQDGKGFIWISTKNGLARFDGIDFINYYKKDGLPSNFVRRLFEDSANDLWALSMEGLSKYTGDGFIFYPPGPEFQRKYFLTEVTATEQPGKIFIIAYNKDNFTNEVILFENGRYSTYSANHHPLDELKFGSIGYDTTQSDLLLLDLSKQLWSYKNETLTKLSPREFSYLHYDRNKILIRSNDTIFEYLKRNFYPRPFENKTGRAEVQFLQSYQK